MQGSSNPALGGHCPAEFWPDFVLNDFTLIRSSISLEVYQGHNQGHLSKLIKVFRVTRKLVEGDFDLELNSAGQWL